MRYRTLGASGLRVSVVGLGCNNMGGRIDVTRTRAVVDAAIEEGVTLFDTAELYGAAPGASEELLGEVLAGRRDTVVLADGITPIEETLAALTELVREGKVRYIGSSNFAGWQIAEAAHVARAGGYTCDRRCDQPRAGPGQRGGR